MGCGGADVSSDRSVGTSVSNVPTWAPECLRVTLDRENASD
jgi:hypothetical protein